MKTAKTSLGVVVIGTDWVQLELGRIFRRFFIKLGEVRGINRGLSLVSFLFEKILDLTIRVLCILLCLLLRLFILLRCLLEIFLKAFTRRCKVVTRFVDHLDGVVGLGWALLHAVTASKVIKLTDA